TEQPGASMARSLRQPEEDVGSTDEWELPQPAAAPSGLAEAPRAPAGSGPAGESDGQWAVPAGVPGSDDALLECLVVLTRLLERPASPQALTAGLPLPDGRLTPDLAVRAAERAGLSARLARQPLERISALTLPCVLLLDNQSACVLVDLLPGERALVALPESGGGAREVPLAQLTERYLGVALFARPQLRLDRPAAEVAGSEPRRWFWGTLAKAWPIYAEVLLAAALINLFALASPLFIMNV